MREFADELSSRAQNNKSLHNLYMVLYGTLKKRVVIVFEL